MRVAGRSVRIKVAAAAVVPLLMAVTACGSDDDGDGKAVEPLTAEQVTAALVVAADLPGYEVEAGDDGSDSEPEKADKPECQPLLQLVTPDQEHKAALLSAATATKPESESDGTVNWVAVSQFDGDAGARILDEAKAALSKCTQFVSTDSEGTTTTYAVKEGPKIGFGDQSLAVEYDTGDQAGKVTVKWVRTGPVVVQAMATNLGFGEDEVPKAVVVSDDIVRTQFDKVVKAQQG